MERRADLMCQRQDGTVPPLRSTTSCIVALPNMLARTSHPH